MFELNVSGLLKQMWMCSKPALCLMVVRGNCFGRNNNYCIGSLWLRNYATCHRIYYHLVNKSLCFQSLVSIIFQLNCNSFSRHFWLQKKTKMATAKNQDGDGRNPKWRRPIWRLWWLCVSPKHLNSDASHKQRWFSWRHEDHDRNHVFIILTKIINKKVPVTVCAFSPPAFLSFFLPSSSLGFKWRIATKLQTCIPPPTVPGCARVIMFLPSPTPSFVPRPRPVSRLSFSLPPPRFLFRRQWADWFVMQLLGPS